MSGLTILCVFVLVVQYTQARVVSRYDELLGECCPDCPRLTEDFSFGRYAGICQYYANKPHYATVYDTVNRIPVYSMFRIDFEKSRGRLDSYRTEPQLLNIVQLINMANNDEYEHHRAQKQATQSDYNGAYYDKGHLNPAAGHNSQEATYATFTLTNVIPQVGSFNQQCWRNVELRTRQHVSNMNSPNAVLVGAIPGFADLLNARVNIPSYIFTYIKVVGVDDIYDIIAFLVPNKENDLIKNNMLLTAFCFPASMMDSFLMEILSMYLSKSSEEQDDHFHKLRQNPPFRECRRNYPIFSNLGCNDDGACTCFLKKNPNSKDQTDELQEMNNDEL